MGTALYQFRETGRELHMQLCGWQLCNRKESCSCSFAIGESCICSSAAGSFATGRKAAHAALRSTPLRRSRAALRSEQHVQAQLCARIGVDAAPQKRNDGRRQQVTKLLQGRPVLSTPIDHAYCQSCDSGMVGHRNHDSVNL